MSTRLKIRFWRATNVRVQKQHSDSLSGHENTSHSNGYSGHVLCVQLVSRFRLILYYVIKHLINVSNPCKTMNYLTLYKLNRCSFATVILFSMKAFVIVSVVRYNNAAFYRFFLIGDDWNSTATSSEKHREYLSTRIQPSKWTRTSKWMRHESGALNNFALHSDA